MSSEVLTGTVNITGYTSYTDDVIADDVLFNIYHDARMVLFGDDLFTDDTIAMDGQLRNRGTLAIDDGLTLLNAPLFVNAGAVTQSGGDFQFQANGVENVRNIVGATWNLVNNAGIKDEYGELQFVNLGLIEQTGSPSSTSTIDGHLIERGGTIQVNGTLNFSTSDSFSYSSRFVNDTIEGSGTVDFYGYFNVIRLYWLYDYDVLFGTNVSSAFADLGVVRIVNSVTVSSATIDIELLNLGADSILALTNPSAQVILQERINGAGRLNINGDDQVTQANISLRGGVTIANYGNTTFAHVQLLTFPWGDDQITIENEAGATWKDAHGYDISTFIQSGKTGTSVFINNGTFVENTTDGVTFGMAVANDDVIEAGANLTSNSSVFTFYDSVTGSGTIEIGLNGVTFNNSVGSGQTLNFNAVPSGFGAPTLTLADPQSFAGLITGFDQNGAMDDQIVADTSVWQFQDFVANLNDSGGSLIFSNGSAQSSVSLVGEYDPGKFHTAVSGTRTTITYG